MGTELIQVRNLKKYYKHGVGVIVILTRSKERQTYDSQQYCGFEYCLHNFQL